MLQGTMVGCSQGCGEIHVEWNASVPRDLLKVANLDAIKPVLKKLWNGRPGATPDLNALRTLLALFSSSS
jgi:hypothetical protein